jgi:hypothetical protein
LVHLNQMLVAGQSMPVAQQHQDSHASDLTQAGGASTRCLDEGDIGHVDVNVFRIPHDAAFLSQALFPRPFREHCSTPCQAVAG